SRSSWSCCPSTSSATACAMRSIRASGRSFQFEHDPLGKPLHTFPDHALDHYLPHHPAAIHLIFEIDHRRPRKVPGQAGSRGAALHQLISDDMMIIADRVDLRCRCILPAEAEGTHAALHGAHHMADLVLDAVSTEVAIAHGALRVRSGAFQRLPA